MHKEKVIWGKMHILEQLISLGVEKSAANHGEEIDTQGLPINLLNFLTEGIKLEI